MNHKTERDEALAKWQRECEGGSVPVTPMMRHAYRDGWDDALAGQSAGVPTGYALVPIEPTMEMVKAGSTSGGLGMDFHEWMGRIKVAWRHMIAAAPAPVSAPYPATLCEDGGKCGIGGYCGQCEKVRAASEPEQPSERGEHNFESDKPIPIVTYDDGTCVMLDSWTGGAHEAGVFGEIALRFTDAHGVETVREYVARTSEQPNAHGERPIEPEDIDAVAEAIQRETSVEWLIASRAAVAAIDTLIARGNHASEHGEQDCPHGVDDGACKQCYGEAVSGEQGALPQLKEGEEFVCGDGCGTTTPESYDFEYSREEFPDGRVESKTEKGWRASCCKADLMVYSNLEDTFTPIEDYIGSAPTLEPVHGDVLPAIGEQVLIHLASADVWELHTVVGYYVWPDLRGDSFLQRVFVRVRHSDGTMNARMLRDVRRADGSHYVEPTVKLPAPQPRAAEPKQPPFGNCQFRICDLPGQCRAEGKCHHPAAQAAEPKGCPRCKSSTAAGCNDIGCGYLDSGSGEPNSAEPKGLTIEQIEKAALDFVKKPGMQGYVEPGDLIDFARALLSKGE